MILQQSILLTHAAPDDGTLKTMHLPKTIQRLTVNPDLCAREREKQTALAFDSVSALAFPHANMVCDIDLYPDDLDHAMAQVQGLKCVPVSRQTPKDDREVFSNVVWDVADPDPRVIACDVSAKSDQIKLAAILERASCFYLRILEQEVSPNHYSKIKSPYKGRFQFASHISSQSRNGELSFWQKEWEQDSPEVLAAACEPFADAIDVKLITGIGEHMIAVVKGNNSAMDVVTRGRLMEEWYQSGLGISTSTKYLAQTVKQIVHRYPQMHILEMRAEMGTATKVIVDEIGPKFASYTVTAPTSSGFDPTQAWLETYEDKIKFQPSDYSKDFREQGFSEASYDLVVACLALHAVPDLDQTLRNLRRLLKPGGYLLVLDLLPSSSPFFGLVLGGHSKQQLGAEEEGPSSLASTPAEWNSLLRNTGFSGIDTSIGKADDVIPFSVFVSQAVDNRIAFLRDPLSLDLSASAPKQIIQDLIIVGGNGLETTRFASQLSTILRPYCGNIRDARSLPEFLDVDISSETVVLSLTDLDTSVFKELTNARWEALKKMVLHVGTLIWVSQGRLAENPHANMMLGLVRGAARDNPELDYLLLDIEDTRKVDSRIIAENVLRHKARSQWQQLNDFSPTVENELVLDKAGRFLIPRLIMNEEMNDRYNSDRREIRGQAQPSLHNVGISRSESSWDIELEPAPCKEDGETIRLRTTHSVLSPIRVAEFGCLFVVLGKDKASGEKTVALSFKNNSLVFARKELSIAARIPSGSEAHFLWLVAHRLLTSVILRGLSKDNKILIHEPSPEFASTIGEEAALLGVPVTLTTANAEALPVRGSSWLVIHPAAPERAIARLAEGGFSVFVDLTPHAKFGSIGDRIASALPFYCRRENFASMFGKRALEPTVSHLEEVHNRLVRAIERASTVLAESGRSRWEDVPTSDMNSFPKDVDQLTPLTVLDWTSDPEVSVKVRPIDLQVSLSSDRTYWLVGLTGGLGLSLCDWMVQRGARYLVLTSRKPNIETAWLDGMRARGVSVKVSAW